MLVVHEMILVIVFSRDRALQLQATLESFVLQVPDAAMSKVVVLYRTTSARHESQYRALTQQFGGRVRFVEEVSFRNQVIDILNGSSLGGDDASPSVNSGDSGDHCLFLVDDNIFVRPIRLRDAQLALESNPDALGLSLRLGRNTTYCYSLSRPQALPRFSELENGLLKFRWRGSDGDFGYPLEISSSMYGLHMLRDLISGLPFEGPSALESQLALRARHFSGRQPALLCSEHSVAFCTPVNRVQEVYDNRTGAASRFSVENLADLFDQGMRIDVHSLAGFMPRSCHQEIELDFERANDHNHSG
jgi:hypothetical protein